MPKRASKAEGGALLPDDVSDRFTIASRPFRIRHFPGAPDVEPPAGTTVIPSSDGLGVFWLTPESIRIMLGDPCA